MRYKEMLPVGAGPCAKKVVYAAIVSADRQHVWEGTNWCRSPQQECPRKGMPTGQGYELCRDVCKQSGHAETNALAAAGEGARGGTLLIEGHTYACEGCKQAARDAGIAGLVIEGRCAPLSPYEPRTTFAGANPFVNPLDHEQTK